MKLKHTQAKKANRGFSKLRPKGGRHASSTGMFSKVTLRVKLWSPIYQHNML